MLICQISTVIFLNGLGYSIVKTSPVIYIYADTGACNIMLFVYVIKVGNIRLFGYVTAWLRLYLEWGMVKVTKS